MSAAPRSRRLLALLLVVTGLAACDGAESGGSRVHAEPLTWTVARGAWPEPRVETVRLLQPPDVLGDEWTTDDESEAEVVANAPGSPGGLALRLRVARGPNIVRVHLDPPLRRFDLARVRMSTLGFVRAMVSVQDTDGVYTLSEFREGPPGAELHELEFDLAEFLERGTEAKLVELRFQAMTQRTDVFSIELLHRSVSARLPSPEEPARPVRVGSTWRHAVAVIPEVALEAALPAHAVGSISVGACLPPGGTAEDARARYSVLLDGEVVSREEVPLVHAWTDRRIELPPAGDGALRLSVETDAVGGALVDLPVWSSPRPAGDAPARRTVLLVTSDTHRADHVGYALDGVGVETPTIDAIGARGVLFDDAVSASSITNPSHASILTGLTTRETGIVGNLVPLSERAETLAERFRDAGFRTVAATSARHLAPDLSGFGQGFERFDVPRFANSRSGEETVAAAREMLRGTEDSDVFVWLHLFDAHGPYDEHECCTARYYTGDPYDEDDIRITAPALPRWDRKIRDEEYVRALYKGEVTYLDRMIDDFLSAEPRFRDGWIAITADHGESMGEQELYWTHSAIYPSTIRVPLLIAGPGVPVGERRAEPVCNYDVGRTLLELAGVAEPGDDEVFPGLSLLDSARGTADTENPRFVIGEGGLSAGVMHERWYLVLHLHEKRWGNPGPSRRHQTELYDLDSDRWGIVNVADEHEDVARRMRAALVTWLATPPTGGRLAGEESTSASAAADVAALGYAADEASAIDDELIDPDCDCAACERWR